MMIFERRRKVNPTLKQSTRVITAEPTIEEMSQIAVTMSDALGDLIEALKDVHTLGELDYREPRSG